MHSKVVYRSLATRKLGTPINLRETKQHEGESALRVTSPLVITQIAFRFVW